MHTLHYTPEMAHCQMLTDGQDILSQKRACGVALQDEWLAERDWTTRNRLGLHATQRADEMPRARWVAAEDESEPGLGVETRVCRCQNCSE